MKDKNIKFNKPQLLGFSLEKVIIATGGKTEEFILKGKNQKDLVQYLIKVNKKNLCQVAEHLNKLQQNLYTTLQRENLSFWAFLEIYKFSTGKDFKTHIIQIDSLKGLYHLKLKDVVNLLEAENRPFLVKCGNLYYKMVNK